MTALRPIGARLCGA